MTLSTAAFADLLASGYTAAEIRALVREGRTAEITRAKLDRSVSTFVPGSVDPDLVSSDPGDGAPYQAPVNGRRYQDTPDSRKGTGVTKRDAIAFRDSGRTVVTGETRTVPMAREGMGPLATGTCLDSALAAIQASEVSSALASAPRSVVATIAARADRLDSVRRVPFAPTALDSAVRGTVRGDWTGLDGRPATAKLATDAIKASGLATRYALDSDVTGALPRAHMRVRAPLTSPTIGLAPKGLPASDTVTAAREQALRVAVADLTRAFAARNRGTGAARKAATSQIGAIVDLFGDNAAIVALCRANDWTIKIKG